MTVENSLPKKAVEDLKNCFTGGRCPHALLIDGGSEEERMALGRLAAKMLVCGAENAPCNNCENCRKADENIHPDIILVEKPKEKRNFVKKDIKDMVSEAYLTPNDSAKKVFIISEMQNMSEECQNVLLKILEEPPQYTAFVLTSLTSNVVIGTVLSRVIRLRLSEEQEIEYSEKASLVVKNLARALVKDFEYDKIKATAPMDNNKTVTAEVLELFTRVLRDAIALKSGGKILLKDFEESSTLLADKKKLSRLLEMYDTVNELYRSLENNPNYTLLSAVLCARI